MRWLRDQGHLVHGSQYTCPLPGGGMIKMPQANNPGGYYECPVTDLTLMEGMGGFTKIWPGRLQAQRTAFKPRALIVLKRMDRFAQVRSAEDQLVGELRSNPKLICGSQSGRIPSPQDIVQQGCYDLCDYVKDYDGPLLRVQTEDLDYQVKTRIPEFIEEVLNEEG